MSMVVLVSNKVMKLLVEYFKILKGTLFAYLSMYIYSIFQYFHSCLGLVIDALPVIQIEKVMWEYVGAMFGAITAVIALMYMFFNYKTSKANAQKAGFDLEKSKQDLRKAELENQILESKQEIAKKEIEKIEIENKINEYIGEFHMYEESAHKQKEFYNRCKQLADSYVSMLTPEQIKLKQQIEEEFNKLFPKK